MSERPIDLARVSAVVETLLRDSGKPVCVTDLTTGEIQPVSPELAASPAGLLPLFLAAGDTVWRDTTGRRLGIKQVDDPPIPAGCAYRKHRCRAGHARAVERNGGHGTGRTALTCCWSTT